MSWRLWPQHDSLATWSLGLFLIKTLNIKHHQTHLQWITCWYRVHDASHSSPRALSHLFFSSTRSRFLLSSSTHLHLYQLYTFISFLSILSISSILSFGKLILVTIFESCLSIWLNLGHHIPFGVSIKPLLVSFLQLRLLFFFFFLSKSRYSSCLALTSLLHMLVLLKIPVSVLLFSLLLFSTRLPSSPPLSLTRLLLLSVLLLFLSLPISLTLLLLFSPLLLLSVLLLLLSPPLSLTLLLLLNVLLLLFSPPLSLTHLLLPSPLLPFNRLILFNILKNI